MMRYAIRHVTRFEYADAAGFARCNLRLKPILWSGQTLDDYHLSVEPGGETAPARAQAGLANVMRLVVEKPERELTIESRALMTVDRPLPMPAPDDPTLAEIAAWARDSRDVGPASPASYLFPSPTSRSTATSAPGAPRSSIRTAARWRRQSRSPSASSASSPSTPPPRWSTRPRTSPSPSAAASARISRRS